jgi:ATP-dependent helicase HrpA
MQQVNDYQYPESLPIVAHRAGIVAAIQKNQVIIVAGETGSGKTTQLPKMCLEAGKGKTKAICCTQPRRIAAFAVAARVAEELVHLGPNIVGYKIRFRDKTSSETKIKFVTDGMLLAETQNDRKLSAYDTIIIDEAHERSLNIDFILGILTKLQGTRDDLKIIISSATLDVEKFSAHFKGAPVIEISGRSYPIQIEYLEKEAEEKEDFSHIDHAIDKVLTIADSNDPGDVLVFMPTERDIMEVSEGLSGQKNITVLPLFGRMAGKEQSRIFSRTSKRKVVVATNVAETSITVPGIRFVIDSGLARIAGYNARARTTKLPVVKISKASADQRKGRCGRVGPGICYRLYSEENYLSRPEFTPPEIVRSNLAEVILRMINLHLGHPAGFPFIDKPSPRSIADGFKLLEELGAVSVGVQSQTASPGLTKRGRFMAQLPLDPRISRMIIEAREKNCLREILVIASALSVTDPRIRPLDRQQAADEAHARFVEPGSDFISYLKIWELYHQTSKKVTSRSKLRAFCSTNFLGYQRMREWCDIYEQLCRIVRRQKGFLLNSIPAHNDAVHQAILSGALRNIALKKSKKIFAGAQGKDLMIFPGSGLFEKSGQWIMAGEIVETSRLYAKTVAVIDPNWIQPLAAKLCKFAYSDPHWEKKRGIVAASEKVSLFGLVISANKKVNYGPINKKEARDIFIQAALVEGQCQTKYKFLQHNFKLVEEFSEIEEKLRKKRVIDEYGLFQFYNKHLPENVFDIRSLDQVLGQIETKLFLKEADVVQEEGEQFQPELFPESIRVGEHSFQLSYRFAPGTLEDGVTVLMPVDILRHLDPGDFDWLVPGFIDEKISWLLKGLPKKIRKKLIPIASTSEAVCQMIQFGKGSLYKALEDAIWKKYQIRIIRSDWQVENIPDHLKMRFCVKQNEKVLCAGRQYSELLKGKESGDLAKLILNMKNDYERDHLTDIDFPELPERLPVYDENKALAGFVFPGLVFRNDGSFSLRLFLADDKRRHKTQEALLELYKLKLGRQARDLEKELVLKQTEWPLFEGLGTYKEINSLITSFVERQLFQVNEGLIPSMEDVQRRLASFREKSILSQGREIFVLVKTVLGERRMTLDHIRDFGKKAAAQNLYFDRLVKDTLEQVRELFSASSFATYSSNRLELLPRYFKAIRIRIERAYVNIEQDKRKWDQVVSFVENVRMGTKLLGRKRPPKQQAQLEKQLDEYWVMVEEYKVSIFAQELKTSQPVSAKRLRHKWLEIGELCAAGG